MGALIDAAREARGDDVFSRAQLMREPFRESEPCGGGVSCADNGDHRALQNRQFSLHAQQWRRGVDLAQGRRIFRLSQGDQQRAKAQSGLHLALAISAGGQTYRSGASGAFHQRGQRFQRRAGAAELVDQRAKSTGADVVAADQLQPVEPLFVR
jgi:hypothetical protein